jgi:hypothetical protein
VCTGDENDVIVLSLVRSNEKGTIGFLNRPNRYCVALSRARHALYVCGNMNMLADRNEYWRELCISLAENITPDFCLVCPTHHRRIRIHANQARLGAYVGMLPFVRHGFYHSDEQCSHAVRAIDKQNETQTRSRAVVYESNSRAAQDDEDL